MTKIIVGIDPGKDGFIAGIDEAHYVVATWPTPTLQVDKSKREYDLPEMLNILSGLEPDYVVLEHQQVFPGQGGVSNFSTGYGYGLWRMALVALKLPHEIVRPAVWKKELGVTGVKGSNPKTLSVIAASRYFPHEDLRVTAKCKKPHDGKADALLLALYGMRKLAGIRN
jgi:hypothetical protein